MELARPERDATEEEYAALRREVLSHVQHLMRGTEPLSDEELAKEWRLMRSTQARQMAVNSLRAAATIYRVAVR